MTIGALPLKVVCRTLSLMAGLTVAAHALVVEVGWQPGARVVAGRALSLVVVGWALGRVATLAVQARS